MEPILTFAIVKAINIIFKSGIFTFLISIYDFIIPLIGIIFVTLFSVIINTSSSFILRREGFNGIKICKMIPVGYRKQIFVKMVVPFISSLLSLIITIVVLIAFKEITIINGLLAFSISLVLIILMEMICASSEFRFGEKEGSSLNAVIELISIFVPILFIGIVFLLSYLGLNFYIAFLIPFSISLLTTIIYFIVFQRRINKNFILLETRN